MYFDVDTINEMKAESLRQDRTLSWLAQQAWRLARHEVKKYRWNG
jgi:uncharacterized small protein (TIGR04563 family)